jgi:hypothetical protein
MATNVNIYVPNQGEKEALRAILKTKALVLGLYKTAVIGEGATLFESLTEWPADGGRAYARKELSTDIVEDAVAASKWFLTTNALGRAEGQYNNAVLSWAFNAVDVADVASVYGVFAFSWALPFDAGAIEVKVGDKIKGATSGATGIVTGVCVISGTWGAGTAAGQLDIMTKTGTFQDGENITIVGAINATSLGTAAGTGYAVGDMFNIIQAGASGGKGIVLTVNAGAVVTFAVINPGTGYTVANNKTTTKITGGGDDALTVDVDSLAATVYAVTNTGATADAHKRLMAIWPFASPLAITADGQAATWDMKMALATGV